MHITTNNAQNTQQKVGVAFSYIERNIAVVVVVVVVVVDDDTYYWVYLCDSIFYYKVRQVLLQSATGITKSDNFITNSATGIAKCDGTGVLKIRLEHNKECVGYHQQIY